MQRIIPREESRAVEDALYDPAAACLYVQYQRAGDPDGPVPWYRYDGVSANEVQELVHAKSIGSAMGRIKERHTATKLDDIVVGTGEFVVTEILRFNPFGVPVIRIDYDSLATCDASMLPES